MESRKSPSTMTCQNTVQELLHLINSSAKKASMEYEGHGGVPTLGSTAPHPLDFTEDAVSLRKSIRVLEGACQQLCTLLAPPAHTVINRAQALDWACIKFAVDACLADLLKDKPEGLHITNLASLTGIHAGKLRQVLRLLATENIFSEVKPDIFANNRLSVYLESTNGISALAYCQAGYAPKAAIDMFSHFTVPETGDSYHPAHSAYMSTMNKSGGGKGTFFSWLLANPKERGTFGQAMLGLGHVMNSLAILHHYPWSSAKSICDVGSGIGAFSLPLAKAYPDLNIVLFDLPDTIKQAEILWSKENQDAVQRGQVMFISGDFFESVPARELDIYYLRNIIHNWPDAEAQNIFHTVRDAMGKNSRLLIHDYVLSHVKQTQLEVSQVERAPSPLLPNYGAGAIRTYNQDMTMLIMYNAKERTLDESVALASDVGLKLVKVWDLAEASVLEFSLKEDSSSSCSCV